MAKRKPKAVEQELELEAAADDAVWRGDYDYYEPLTIGTPSGESVGPDSGLRLSAYFACCKVVAEDTAKLPLITYERLKPKGKAPAREHPNYNLLHLAPSDEYTSMTFRESMMYQCLSRGNGYAEIQRNGLGVPVALHLLDADRVEPKRDKDSSRIYYEIRQPDGSKIRLPTEDMLHVRGIGSPLRGWSVARLAAESLGAGLATQTFAASYFGNGTRLGGILEIPKMLSKTGRDALKESFERQHKGAAQSHKPIVLWNGVTYKPLEVKAEEAQFIESREFSVEDICRWFRVPPHKIQHLKRATYSNIEHQGIEYVTDTLMPWLVRMEQECNRKLFVDDPDHFCEHSIQALMRGDAASRSAFYTSLFNIGVLSPNDIAELENRNPVPGGNKRFIPLNMTPLDAPEDDDDEPPDDDEPMEDEESMPPERSMPEALACVVASLAARWIRVEKRIAEKASSKNQSFVMPDSEQERILESIEPVVRAFFSDDSVGGLITNFIDDWIAHRNSAYDGLSPSLAMATANAREETMPHLAGIYWSDAYKKVNSNGS